MAALLATGHAHAQANVLAQWNFNSVTPDGNTGTGSTATSAGLGTVSLLGGVTGGFASGTANGGSSDPATTDNSGWQTTNYRAPGVGNKTAGAQFNVSTLGFEDVVVSYDLRHSNTSSRYEQFQYSLDGTSFVDFITFDGNAGDTWFRRSVDLSGIAGADNNASFAFRVVSAFAPGTLAYAASNATSSYGAAGTWRFDMVTVHAAVVPEPETYAMLLAGLALMGSIARRRQL
ncbi:MAG: PEP-CTERM sorting domain-containing protein [Comamonadaceae bacterium]|nr:PEP-CTERM sorting domain-containing protein [Comamonadaceae bacterium]